MSDEQKLREYLRKVTGDLRTAHRRVRELEQRRREPIAIVGMSCRYPPDVSLPEELWQLVSSGADALSELPRNRGWDVERLYDPDPDHPGTTACNRGYFLQDIAGFDPGFFGIAPRDALAMDPQQRLMLELSWEALEDAGIDPTSLAGSPTGVFVGAIPQEYGPGRRFAGDGSSRAHDVEPVSSLNLLCGRVSYTLGLEGPAVSMDTACSSSLVALHLACQALRRGECSLALAGGVTAMSHPTLLVGFSHLRVLSPDGRCRPFAAAADGTTFSDGAGLLVLERLADARRLGHRVLAVVRGSAVNQDGASNGLSAPNGPSQERVIRAALADAGLAPGDVDAAEAHGTGTALGDPIEAQALLGTYGQGRADGPLRLGSIKSNIGHASAAAGVAGVIKMVKALEHELLPMTLHVDAPSPHVDWTTGDVRLLVESEPWPAGARRRRVGISSFGVSGTNAHVVLEEAPPLQEEAPPAGRTAAAPTGETSPGEVQGDESGEPTAPAGGWSCGVVPLVVSGRGEAALSGQAGRLRELLERPKMDVLDVAFSLAGRAVFENRGVVLTGAREGALEGLDALAGGDAHESLVQGVAGGGRPVFVFPGQGAQWEGMALALLDGSPVFRDSLRACGRALEELVEWSVEDVLRGADGAPGLERVDVVQPASFAVMVALAELWRSCGVEPGVVVGHSQGEIAAACVAGGLSLADAARVVVSRSRLLREVLAGRGGMVSVALNVERIQERLAAWGGRLGVAAVNGPSAVVVSGESSALDELLAACERDGVWARRVAVDYASHSAAVEELRDDLVRALDGIEPVSCGVPFFSTATGELLDTAELGGEYWYRSLRERVRFEEAIRALAGEACAFVEVSPHPVLGVAVRETLEALGVEERVGVVGSLRRDEGGMERFVRSLAEAWVWGAPVDWRGCLADSGARRVDLPRYAFQRQRYWLNPGVGTGDASGLGLGVADHPLLGAAVQVAGGEGWLFTGRLSLDTHAWVADHVVLESVVLPGTALLELVLAAGRRAGCETVEELTFEAPLVLAPGAAVQLQVLLGEPEEQGHRRVTVHSRLQAQAEEGDGGGWTLHASGTLLAEPAGAEAGVAGASAPGAEAGDAGASARAAADGLQAPGLESQWPPAGVRELDVELLYDRLAEAGFGYGPLFRGVRAAWRADGEIYTEVALAGEDAAGEAGRFGVHPALLDAALHGLYFLAVEDELPPGSLPLPFSLGGVTLARQGAAALRVRLARTDGNTMSVTVWDESGEPVLTMRSLAFRPVQAGQLAGGRRGRGSLLRNVWVQASLDPGEPARLATLGDVTVPGVQGARYADLAALAQALEGGEPAPDCLFVAAPPAPADDAEGGLAPAVRAAVQRTLELLQAWLDQPGLAESRLVLLTRGAVALAEDEAPDLAGAACWGLARGAQAEYPGRMVLVDLDVVVPAGPEEELVDLDVVVPAAPEEELVDLDVAVPADPEEEPSVDWAALLAAEEPQVAVRGARAYVPRVEPVGATPDTAPVLDPEGTVLITGGTGGLGALVARHLAGARGARHLLLASRSGPRAEGADEFVAELCELGCEARVAACDVSDRGELAALLDSIPAERPLRAVVHAAGVLDDGLVQSLTAEQVERVMRPKADAALHLHELTERCELSELVLFSSAAGLLGGAGQANYAAANALLDALAQRRRAEGLAGKAIAWGLWEQESGMTAGLDDRDRARMVRLGVSPLPSERGLELLDSSRGAPEALVVAAHLDVGALRKQARVGILPPLLSGLVRMPARRSRGGSLARRLAGVAESEWDAVVLELVRTQAGAILGHDSPADVDPERAFKDLGFDSLGAVELRNRLVQVTGLRLPATLVFDHPTCRAVAEFLRARVEAGGGVPAARSEARERRAGREEPIAIVGMACRYPGGVRNPAELWELLVEGRDAVSGFPGDRGWDLERLYDPDPDHARTSYVREGGFVRDVGDFDAEFFSISPREALTMDPHQRLLLETAWEAFEDAGIDPASLRGSRSGVFVGVTTSHYALRVPAKLEGLQLTGNSPSVASGRLSYAFGLEGPAVSVDTACSSSLVALHLACRALRDGECALALAAGASLMASPGMYVEFSRQRGLAADGRCKSFAAAADGVGWAEGVGVVALERLSDAERLGHRVLALVRGSAVNQDGASNGLTAPNGPSQERVIRQALADAGLSAAEVDAVEAHGTGTRLGDPIEAQALLATYGQGRQDGPVRLGSIKSNIGHAIAASGVAGVIKMALALRHELLPATLHVDEPSPHVDWSAGEVRLLTEPQAWPAGGRPRRAGISSFGISGTNAHVILEEPPPAAAGELAPDTRDPQVPELTVLPWLVSGRSETALRAQAARLHAHLQAHPELEPLDVAFTLATARAQHARRAAVLADDRDRLVAGLAALARGERVGSVLEGRSTSGRTAFMFTGQGAQRAGMGAELYRTFLPFRKAFDEVCAELDRSWETLAAEQPSRGEHLGRPSREAALAAEHPRGGEHLGRPLREAVFAAEGSPEAAALDGTELAQAALFAFEVALARLLEAWGVRPDLLIGHSIGEVVAAHLAGVFSLADACVFVAARGRLMGALPTGGAMLAVEATAEELAPSLERAGSQLALAAVNGPRAVVVSGDAAAVEELAGVWREHGRKVSRLRVSHAFHSPRMEPMLAELGAVVGGLTLNPPRIAVASNLTGELVAEEQICAPEYWVRHVRETVRFADGVRALERAGATHFVEVGPDGVLCALGHECLSEQAQAHALLLATQRARDPEVQTLVRALAQAHVAGVSCDWPAFYASRGARPVELPTYAFQRERYWLAAAGDVGGEVSAAGLGAAEHPMLGAVVRVAGGEEWLLTGRLSPATHAWIADHAVLDTVLLPGTAFLELLFAVGRRAGVEAVVELTLEVPLVFALDSAVQLQVSLGEPDGEGRRAVAVHSRPDSAGEDLDAVEVPWTRHASGLLAPAGEVDPAIAQLQAQGWPPAGAEPLDTEYLYDRLAEIGFGYGPAFQVVRRAWRRGEELFVEAALGERQVAAAESFRMHPALFDATLHPLFGEGGDQGAGMPFSWSDVRLYREGASSLRAAVALSGPQTMQIAALDEQGEPLLSVGALVGRPVDTSQLAGARVSGRDSLYTLGWTELALAAGEGRPPRLAVLGELEVEVPDAERHADVRTLGEAIAAGAPSPDMVLASIAPAVDGQEVPQAARACAARALELLQAWLAQEQLAGAQLVLLSRGAVAAQDGEVPDLATAPVWGLVRSAQSEHPDRFLLLDLDPASERGAAELAWGELGAADEPQLAVRGGRVLAPRLARVSGSVGEPVGAEPGGAGPAEPEPAGAEPVGAEPVGAEPVEPEPAEPEPVGPEPVGPDAEATVLITGGTGGLGAVFARHLAAAHGARRLVLTSRRGPEAEGAGELVAELAGLGCEARVVACDVADRAQCEALIAGIGEEHPLRGVIHAAGVLDDGLVGSLDVEQVERVMRPKVDGAHHLHELTEGLGLSEFVLFSSAAGAMGSPGQANYAAGNAFLDALAQHRRAQGLAGRSLAWGLWAQQDGMAGALDQAGSARLGRLGVLPLERELGLELFDDARLVDRPLLVPVRVDMAGLRAQARAGVLPALLRGLVRVPPRREREGSLARRLADVPADEWDAAVLELVCSEVAAVLGHDTAGAIDPHTVFTDLGFDSLGAVELRNRLTYLTGLRLPATLVFDHPTAAAVAKYLLTRVQSTQTPGAAVEEQLDKLETMLGSVTAVQERERIGVRLRSLMTVATGESENGVSSEKIESATVEEIFELIDSELGGQ